MRTVPALIASLALTASASAATIDLTTATGAGADTTVRRNSTANFSNDTTIAIKKQGEGENDNNDRIGLLKFDTSSLISASPIASVTLNLMSGGTTSTGNSGNSFLAGHVVNLYGIPDGHAQENFNPATLTFSAFEFTTGTNGHHARPAADVVINGIDDTLAILLGRFQFPASPQYQPTGTPFSFSTVPLTQFIAGDSNGIVSFILATPTSGPGQVPAIHSAQSTPAGATILTLTIDVAASDPVLPEPAGIAFLALATAPFLLRLLLRHRRCPVSR